MSSSIYQQTQQDMLEKQYTWLITGVAGFVGSHLLQELLMLNQIVIGIDNFITGTQLNIDDVLEKTPIKYHDNFVFYNGDICNIEDCRHVMKNVDFVLHQAALGSIPRSIATPELTTLNNVNGSINIFITASENKVKRLIYASSSSIYGDSPQFPRKEACIGNPLSPYAASKRSVELYAHAFSVSHNLNCIGLRYFNVFGPRQNPNGPYAAVIPKWITLLLNNNIIRINGDGNHSRDFCFVNNVIQANILAAINSNPLSCNSIYNIAVGEQTSLNELSNFLIKLICSNYSSNKCEYGPLRLGDVTHSIADISRAAKLLGYFPKYKIFEGLIETVKWFANKSSYTDNSQYLIEHLSTYE